MKAIMLTIRLKYFYLTYKGIKTIEIRKSAPKDFVGDVYEVVSKTNFEKDLMEIPENERIFFKQFVGKVGLKFTLNKVEEIKFDITCITNSLDKLYTDTNDENKLLKNSCLTKEQISSYLKLGGCFTYLSSIQKGYFSGGYAWHIDNLKIFDRPKELSEFYPYCKDEKCEYRNNHCSICYRTPLTKAYQSWCYVEV